MCSDETEDISGALTAVWMVTKFIYYIYTCFYLKSLWRRFLGCFSSDSFKEICEHVRMVQVALAN